MRVSSRVQFSTVWHCFSVEQPQSATWTSFSTACGPTTRKTIYKCEVENTNYRRLFLLSVLPPVQIICEILSVPSLINQTFTKVPGSWERGYGAERLWLVKVYLGGRYICSLKMDEIKLQTTGLLNLRDNNRHSSSRWRILSGVSRILPSKEPEPSDSWKS